MYNIQNCLYQLFTAYITAISACKYSMDVDYNITSSSNCPSIPDSKQTMYSCTSTTLTNQDLWGKKWREEHSFTNVVLENPS